MGSVWGTSTKHRHLKHYCPQDRLSSQSECLFPCFDLIIPETQKGLSVSKAVLKKPFPLHRFAQVLSFSSSSSSSFLKLPTSPTEKFPSQTILSSLGNSRYLSGLLIRDVSSTIWSKNGIGFSSQAKNSSTQYIW